MTNDFVNKKCQPCEGGVKPFSQEQASKALEQLDSRWALASDKMIAAEFKFANFVEALTFVNKVGDLAEAEGHHPDIILKWGFARIEIWTHAINGLSENDFILAAKIDQLIT